MRKGTIGVDDVLLIVAIVMGVVFLFVVWQTIEGRIARAGPSAIEGAGVAGLALLGRKKGALSSATNLLITIVLVIVVAFVIFLLFASLQAEAGPASNQFFYNTFDSLIKWVSG